jgi:DNA-directed RNA polymerase II subunit RPB1
MPAGFHQPTSDLESIIGIQFGIFSPDEIVKRSVVEVISQATYDGNEPKIGGLFDPRMGVLDNGKTCRSCGQTNHGCPGHFGHYRLARPVYFIQFLPMIRNILRCVCIRCSKLLIDKNNHARITKRRGESRWKAVLDACSKVSRCGQETEDGCGTVRPKTFHIEGIARIVAEWSTIPTAEEGEAPLGKDTPNKIVKQPLEVEYVLRLFRQILDEDVDFMGLSRYWCRPDWMICTVLPIPPPQVRPSVVQDNNQRSEDDLTHKLFEIIKSNKKLQEQINKNSNRNMIDELTTLLQYHVATLVDNKIPGVAPSAQRGGRPLKSLQQRIGSKEGRVRYNIQGKRVEQSARSVITGDPNISIAEVGVPMKIAMNLTRPEMVTVYNRDRLYKYIQNGAEVFPGAKSIIRKDGRMISLKHVNTKELVLYNGDTVNRHLMDGDIILFNRQPTLHRMSMMGHRVRVLPYNTFRLNVTVTRPYNADFDGDEMNAHIPQSYEATVELQEIASVPMQIIRPRDAMPVIGVVQDALAGAYLATRPNNLFTRREFMNMMMKNKRFQDVPEPVSGGRYNGQQIIGTLFPPINISMENSRYDADSQDYNKVKIREGVFSQGVLDKGIFNKAGKGIVHTIYNDYGPKEAVDFMDGLQNMVEIYLIMKGFSVGISDLIADEETRKKMEQTINEKKKEVDDMILQVHMDLFTNNSGKSNQEEFESKAIGILNKATVDSGKFGVESLSDENRLMTMVRSGSKGDATNVAQMIACVGQQAPEGRRIPYGFTDRTLPHYKMFDDGAEARGFVEGSFLRGLTPQEFFFHAMSGREGLIDTAVKTADTGYTQRQLIKAMEDLMTQHDGTVRDASGKIVQFHYGEDGINSTKIEGISLPLGKFTEESLRAKFSLDGVDLSQILTPGTERGDDSEAIEEFVENVSMDRKMLIEGVFGGGRSTALFAPLNIERLLTNFKIKFNLDTSIQTSLTPLMVLNGIETIINKTQPYNKIWCAALRFHLAPHKIIIEERFTVEAWNAFVLAIVVKNMKALAPPGELVGIVAAQSIGEPATQMSIDRSTFIVLNSSKKSYSGPAGPYIDSLLDAKPSSVVSIGKDSVVLDLEDDIFILGVSDKEKTSWKRISQVSRHPANGGLVEVYTRSGRKTIATLSHSFLKRSVKGIVPVLGSDLKVGMRIPVATSISVVPNPTTFVKQGKTTFTLDKDFGWVCGVYLADGCLSGNDVNISKIAPIVAVKLADFAKEHSSTFSERNHQGEYGPSKDNIIHNKDLKNFLLETFNQGSYNKKIGTVVYNAPLAFIRGLISGFFDGDGNVNVARQQIRASSRSKELLQGINRLLGYCSMFGILSEEASVRIPDKTQYTLSIPRKYAKHYETVVGFNLPEKVTALKEVIEYIERDNIHSHQEMIDKIPELGSAIARLGKLLQMPGQSRTYGRWLKKESIGRSTLEEYVQDFKEMIQVHVDPLVVDEVAENLEILESALDADVLWDEITDLVYLDDPKTFVYDFTVPGNDSFMVDDNILVHNTLNTFHQAGVSSKSAMTRGVPRLKELLKVTKNPKANSLTISLKPAFRDDKDRVREVVQDLELTLLRDIVLKSGIYYDPDDNSTIIEEDQNVIAFFKSMELRNGPSGVEGNKPEGEALYSKWIIRLQFDREKMFAKNITMDDIYFVIHNAYSHYGERDNNIQTIYSDYNSQKLIMRIRPKLEDNIYSDHLSSIKKFQNTILNNTIIRGIHGIRAVTWRKDNSRVEEINGKYEEITQYILDTDGTNFVAIMNHPAVDGDRLYSTNVHDIYEQLGIEATRATLYSEINSLFGEADINYRHLGLLCDIMTHAGRLMSADRYGINKMDSGPLAKACFEETEKILLKAALFGEMDPITGVSANIMTGQPIRAGTGFTQILLDEAALPGLMKDLQPLPEDEEEVELPDQNVLNSERFSDDENDHCAQLQTQMNMTLPVAGTQLEDEEEIEIVAL